MTHAELHIRGMIRAIRWRWSCLQASWLLSIAGVVLSAWLLAMILLDNLAMLSSVQLVTGWLVLLAGFAVLAVWMAYRLTVGRPGDERLALMYELRVLGQQNRLINAVQWLHSGRAEYDPIVQAVIMENTQSLDLRSAGRAITFVPVRKMLIACGIGILLLAVYGVSRPDWASNALARLFHPIHPKVHVLATEPTVTPGDMRLIEGEPLAIGASVRPSLRGHLPETVDLEYRVAGLDWTRTAMLAQSESEFSYEFGAVRHPMEYRVRAGPSLSPVYRVEVRHRPHVESLQVSITRPKYAGGQTRQLKPGVGDVAALTGSSIALDVVASVELLHGHVELAGGVKVPIRVTRNDRRCGTARFKLRRSGSYSIHLADDDGLSNIHLPRYTLTAEPDQPPVAIVTRPGRDLILPANATVSLVIEAEDDLGLSRLVLQTRMRGSDWTGTEEWGMAGPDVRHHAVGALLPLDKFGIDEGDVLLYRVLAYDHRRPEPNVGMGRTWSINVAKPDDDSSLLAGQTKRLLDALKQILALQRENRVELDMDRIMGPIRSRQDRVRELTIVAVDEQRKSLRPVERFIDELVNLADGPMLQAIQQLAGYEGTYQQRRPLKQPILDVMDEIITRLEALIAQANRLLGLAEKARETMEGLTPQGRDQALKQIRDMLAKLRAFVPEQDKVIAKTEELVRKGEDLTDGDLKEIEQLKGTEDKWAEVFTDSVKDINKLTEQGFADRSIANDYKEMVEQIEAASLNLTPELIELAVPREQAGREMAESLAEEMEMWLPNSPDHIKWMMEEPLETPEIPMVDLPDQLWDMIGDLIEDQDELNDAAEDVTSAWADSIAEGAGWAVMDGPISNFSAVGKTGNQLPDDHELSGRSGDGRSGRSQGQLVEDVAKGLQGRQTPTRITNDPYEQGVVKELQQMATGGATGGGKARGAGQEGLQGKSPPPLVANMKFMKNWQQRIRQKAERVAGQLKMVRVSFPELDKSIALMKRVETAAADGRYAEMFKRQQMVLQHLKMTGELSAREVTLRIDRAYHLPADQRQQMLDAMDEPVAQEYEDAVRRYFQQLSEAP